MKASYVTWPSHPPEHSLSVRDSKMGNYSRTACCLLGYRHCQEQRAPSFCCGRLEAQLDHYLVYLFQDRDFSQSGLATGYSPAASVRRGRTAPSFALLAPPVSFPCPNANGGISPLAIGLPNWLTLRLPRMNQTWKGESTEV